MKKMTTFSVAVRLLFIAIICNTTLLTAQELPERASPFTAVKWEEDTPIVMFKGEWYKFEQLDELPTTEIVSFCKKKYGDRWQKRFSEDLVEVLAEMDYKPKVDVKLLLRKDGKLFMKNGVMSEENRSHVRDYNKNPDATVAAATEAPTSKATSAKSWTSESDYRNIAERMASQSDELWDSKPKAGSANLRFLLQKNGKPYAGKVSINTEFGFTARFRGRQIHQGFNPNSNGRWVNDGFEPGSWDLLIEGVGPFEGFSWRKKGITVNAGESPLFIINLE